MGGAAGAAAGLRIGFVLLSSPGRPIPSTRVAVLNMLPLLGARGHTCHVLHAPDTPSERPELPPGLVGQARQLQLDVVVLQKVSGPSVLRFVADLREAGIASCFMFCDVIDPAMVEATDGSVVVTEFLKSLHDARLQARMHVVHDGVERPQVTREAAGPPAHPGRGTSAAPLRAVLVTSAQLWHVPELTGLPRWLELTIVGRYAAGPVARWREAGWAARRGSDPEPKGRLLRFLLHPRIRCVPWSEDGVYRELLRADVGVIPVHREPPLDVAAGVVPDWARKSENRLTLKMAVGLPVVASRIPSYEPVIESGVNAFLVERPAEWLAALETLRDPVARERIGRAARASVLPRFSMECQATLLADALQAIVRRRRADNRVPPPAVTAD